MDLSHRNTGAAGGPLLPALSTEYQKKTAEERDEADAQGEPESCWIMPDAPGSPLWAFPVASYFLTGEGGAVKRHSWIFPMQRPLPPFEINLA